MIRQFQFIIAIILTTILLAAAGLYAYFDEPVIMAIPPAIIASLLLLQFPEYLLYALMLTIPWSIEFNFTPSLGTDLPDEPLMLLAAFASLTIFSARRSRDRSVRLHPLVLIIVAQFIWLIATTITSTEPILSVKYLLAKGWYLLAFVALPLVLFRDERVIRRAALLMCYSMIAFMLYALYRHNQYNWTFEKINDALAPFYRNHVNYSAMLVFTVPVQVAAIQMCANKRLRNVLIVLFIICLGALYFSYARGAWLALIVACAGYWLIRKRLLLLSYIFFILMMIGAVLWLKTNDHYLKYSNDFKSTIFHTNFSEHLAATYEFKDASTAERFYRWVAGVRMIDESWKTGFGPSSFYQQYRPYTQPAFKTWVSKNEEQSTVHNYFLLLIIEQGAIGLLLFVLLLGAMFWYVQSIYHRSQSRFWRIAMASVAAVLLMECAVNFLSDMIETDKAGPVFYVCLAILVTADLHHRRNRTLPEKAPANADV